MEELQNEPWHIHLHRSLWPLSLLPSPTLVKEITKPKVNLQHATSYLEIVILSEVPRFLFIDLSHKQPCSFSWLVLFSLSSLHVRHFSSVSASRRR